MKKYILYLEFFLVCIFFIIPPFISKNNTSELNFSLNIFSLINFAFALLLFYYHEIKTNSWKEKSLLNILIKFGSSLFYFGILIGIQTIFTILDFFFDVNNTVKINVENKFISFFSALVLIGISAFVEEVIYRLYFPLALLSFFNKLCSGIISDKNGYIIKIVRISIEIIVILIFGFSHLYLGWFATINALICGAILRLCYLQNKTVLTGTVSHFLYNSFIFISTILL